MLVQKKINSLCVALKVARVCSPVVSWRPSNLEAVSSRAGAERL